MAIKISNAFLTKLQMVSDGSFNILEDFAGTAGIISGSDLGGGGGGGGLSTGQYLLLASYTPANSNGSITFPNHSANNFTLDPNSLDDGGRALYINQYDSLGNDQSSVLNNLIGNSGTLTLTQGSNSVTYSFTSDAFSDTDVTGQYSWDPDMEASPANGLVVTSPASGNFDTTTPITITVTI